MDSYKIDTTIVVFFYVRKLSDLCYSFFRGETMRLDVRRLKRLQVMMFEKMRYLEDSDRDLPMKWSIMHMYTSTQLAVISALRAGLDYELMGLITSLHDIGAVMTKKHAGHAESAEPFILEIVSEYNSKFGEKLGIITESELEIILEAVKEHSNKDVVSTNPYVEMLKDIDSLDRYLHGIDTTGDHEVRLANTDLI